MWTLSRALLLCTLAALGPPARAAEDPAPRPPDARRGEALYVGAKPLAMGGAPCLACHGVAGHGLARAASYGPDLSGAHATLGAEGLAATLEDVVFPSMVPVYRGRAITPEERGDLVAFLGEAGGAAPARLGSGFAAGIAAAVALFFGVVVLVGRRGSARGTVRTSIDRRTP